DTQAIIDIGGGHTLKIVFDNPIVGDGTLHIFKLTEANVKHLLGVSPSSSLFFSAGGSDYNPISPVVDIDLSDVGVVGGATITMTADGDLTGAKMLHFNGVSWEILSPSSIDSSTHTVGGHTSSFSLFAVGSTVGGGGGPSPNSSGGNSGGGFGGEFPPPTPISSEVGGEEQWNSYKLTVDGTEYTIQYMITNGTVTSMSLDKDKATLSVGVNTTADGNLQLRLPRAVIDAKSGANGTSGDDKPFVVFVGDKSVEPKEATPTSDMRQISIDFTAGTQKIDIMGTMVVPEFGTIAAIVMAVAILGIILATTRYGNRFNFRRL